MNTSTGCGRSTVVALGVVEGAVGVVGVVGIGRVVAGAVPLVTYCTHSDTYFSGCLLIPTSCVFGVGLAKILGSGERGGVCEGTGLALGLRSGEGELVLRRRE